MSRRIDIEITSLSGDLATWRAAGAKLPKGTVTTSLVPKGAKVGDVFRADVDQYMEGLEVLSLSSPKASSPLDPRNERLEILPRASKGPDVVVTYAPKGRSGDRGRSRFDGEGGSRERRPSRDARPSRGRTTREGAPTRPPREGAPTQPERPTREGAPARSSRPRSDASKERSGHSRERREGAHVRPSGPPVLTTHRNALLATLSPEQLPVAEQLLRGGMPAVREAVSIQNQNATTQGRPTVDPVTIERIAEDLLSRTSLALWKDRAAGAMSAGREIRLRDLRAVVTSAKTVNLDDEARTQHKELQSSLNARVEHLRTQWLERLAAAIEGSRAKQALELVASPPDITARVSADTATSVAALVSSQLNAEQSPQVWNELVELASDTSIRRHIKPTGIPADETSHAVAIHNAGAIPEIAKLLGMKVPPPPPPAKSIRRPNRRRAS